MSSQAKLTLRPPPHVNFIQGYPGIPPSINSSSSIRSRPSAHIAGTVEVRLGSKGLKASWLRIELRKLESVGGENWGELIGRGPIDVWTAKSTSTLASNKDKKHVVYKGRDEEDEDGWETLQTADFPFHIAIPEGLPPTAKIDKQSSISYEVVTSLCVLTKKGLLRKESTQSIIQSTHPIALEKHELHSTWPIYHIPEEHASTSDDVSAKVFRNQTCYSPGDSVSIRVIIQSNRVSPVKLKNVSFSIRETITFRGLSQSGAAKRMSSIVASSSSEGKEKAASQRTETIAQKSKSVGKKMYKGDNHMLDLQVQIPKTHSLMTIRTAKHIEVAYTLRVHVDLAKNPIIIDHLPVTICNFSQAASKDLTNRIGYVPGLSDSGIPSAPSVRADSLRYESTAEDPRRRMTRRSASYAGSSASGSRNEMRVASGPSTPVGRTHAMEHQFPFGNGSASPRRPPQRNDTVYTTSSTRTGTTVSGPGVAGRGAAGAAGGGQVFSWGQYGSAQPYSDPEQVSTPPPVRPAFAGPGSIYNGNEGTGFSTLTSEENRALAHHSARPQSLAVLGGYDPLTGASYTDNRTFVPGQIVGAPPPSRPNNFGTIEEEAQGFRPSSNFGQIGGPQIRERRYSTPSSGGHSSIRPASSPNLLSTDSLNPNFDPLQLNNTSNPNLASPSTPNSINPSATPTTPSTPLSNAAAAEAEKMRLYERARQQAERNQRRADEKRAKAANGTGSVMSTATSNRSVSSPEGAVGAFRNSTISSAFSTDHANAEAEKMRLYERARKQAERYQAGYTQGASFPEDEATDPNRLSQSFNHLSTSQEQQSERPSFEKRSSANFWMTPQGSGQSQGGDSSGDSSNNAGRNANGASSTSLVPPTTNLNQASSSSTSLGIPPIPGAFPSAEDEKKRLYEAAKAETEAHLRIASPPPASASHSAPGPSSSSYSAPRTTYQGPSAVDEKAQMKRFFEAQDAVARHQRGESSSTATGAGPTFQTPYETSPVPTYQLATSSRLSVLDGTSSRPHTSDSTSQTPPSSLSILPNKAASEKEQLRLYYAARDAQQSTENQASGSGSSNQTSSPLLARPAPSYAANYSKDGNRSASAPHPQEPVPPVPPIPNQASNQIQAQPQRSASAAGRALPSHMSSSGEGSATLPPSFSSSSSSSNIGPTLDTSKIDEKAQLKAYYEAKDLAEQNARSQGHSNFASSADLYAAPSSSSTPNFNRTFNPPTLPPLQFSSSSSTSASSSPAPPPASSGFNSVLSPIPASAVSATSSSFNPNPSSTFNHIQPDTSMPPPSFLQNPYAPKRAKSSWEELEAEEEEEAEASGVGPGPNVKPPIPPKTPVMR